MDAKGDIVKKALKVLSQIPNCKCSLQMLNERLKKDGAEIVDYDELAKSFEGYADIFGLSDDQSLPTTIIGINAKVPLCEEAKCSKGDGCNGLHICKFFLLSDSCTYHTEERQCIYGHSLDTTRNKKILRSFCLDHLDTSDIRNILKCPRNRTSFSTPRLCSHFQRKNCKTETQCMYLHLCRYYLAGTCRSGDDCSGHDVFDGEAGDLLKKYGIDLERTEHEIKEDLKVMGVISKMSPRTKSQVDGEESAGRKRNESGPKNRGETSDERNQKRGTRQRDSKSLTRQSRPSALTTRPQPSMHKRFGSTQNVQQPHYPSNQQDMPYQYGNQQGPRPQYQNQPCYPSPNQGGYPPPTRGQYPPPNQGGYPPPTRGQYPPPNQGGYPPPTRGQYPPPNQGGYPPPNRGQYPPPNQGGYPPPNRGQYPPPNTGQYPGQNYNGPQPPLWPQTYPYQGPPEPNEWNTECPQPWSQQQHEQNNYQANPACQQSSTPQSANHNRSQNKKDQNDKAAGKQSAIANMKQPEKDTEEICMFHFKTCFRGEKCNYHHPVQRKIYQWQYKLSEGKDQSWRDLDYETNTEVETTYSDPNEDGCPIAFRKGEIVTINFDEMTGTSKRTKLTIRRLSTPSSEASYVRPMTFKFTTLWKWFWKDESGVWIEYGDKDKNGFSSQKKSQAIEQAFLENPKGSIEFVTNAHKYQLQFESMVQINAFTSTKRLVRRRPQFFTKDELGKRLVPNFQQSNKTGPSGWSIGQCRNKEVLADHYAEIKVEETTDEYKKISDLFYETLPGDRKISSLERIENGELWMGFDNLREKMTRKAGKTDTIEERHLFHGTTHDKIEAICHQGFDFRFSGFRVGALHGKGSYFAKEAKYSDSYAEKSDQAKKMFVVRVLVGEFTQGDKSYVRPPPKSTDNPHDLYDSCVDNVADPKIFVVFNIEQAYPEYLITYT